MPAAAWARIGASADVTVSADDLLTRWSAGTGRGGRTTSNSACIRDGQEIDLPPFRPETVGLYPTQFYETVSMLLLIGVLLAFYPFRRHDGQLMVVCHGRLSRSTASSTNRSASSRRSASG